MTNEQKANIRTLVKTLAGHGTEEAAENYIEAILDKALDGEFDEDMVNDAWYWLKLQDEKWEAIANDE